MDKRKTTHSLSSTSSSAACFYFFRLLKSEPTRLPCLRLSHVNKLILNSPRQTSTDGYLGRLNPKQLASHISLLRPKHPRSQRSMHNAADVDPQTRHLDNHLSAFTCLFFPSQAPSPPLSREMYAFLKHNSTPTPAILGNFDSERFTRHISADESCRVRRRSSSSSSSSSVNQWSCGCKGPEDLRCFCNLPISALCMQVWLDATVEVVDYLCDG